jgi:cytoskeleton protein RodZ
MDRRINAELPQDDASASIAGARAGFSAWLRAEREAKGISLDDIARVTKIQIRALERLEEARFDELPADVFVRGFIRNYARVVGLDADAALIRYDDCGVTPGPAASARARAMIETVSDLAPNAARGVQSVQPHRKAPTGPVTLRTPDVIAASVAPPHEMAAGSLRMPVQVAEPEPVAVAAPVAVAVVEPVAVAAPVAEPVAVAAPVAELVPDPADDVGKPKRGKGRRAAAKGRKRGKSSESQPVVEAAPVEVIADSPSEGMEITILVEEPIVDPMPEIEDLVAAEDAPVEAAPPIAAPIVAEASSPRIVLVTPPRGIVRAKAAAPTLVIDDADPESAEREREARSNAKGEGKRSFLPSSLTRALLDNERGTRGGLTLAVIILLIVATLTLSYLMRRPSSSGEGVTCADSTSVERLV